MKDEITLARGWILKGDSDLADARRTVSSEGPFDTACFHTQQATEKYLKAFLAVQRQPIPRTHDLEELVALCVKVASPRDLGLPELSDLTGYAVELRYDPEFWPTRSTASEAVTLAEQVRCIILSAVPRQACP